jgi:hypothetical protein
MSAYKYKFEAVNAAINTIGWFYGEDREEMFRHIDQMVLDCATMDHEAALQKYYDWYNAENEKARAAARQEAAK